MAKTERTQPAERTRVSRRKRLPADLLAAVAAARDKKALELVILDLREAGAFCDYFIVCTGASQRQVHAIADGIEESLKTMGVRPAHIEGHARAEWVLLDYFDFIVHVFSPAARAFYSLERLWGSAVHVDVPEAAAPSPA